MEDLRQWNERLFLQRLNKSNRRVCQQNSYEQKVLCIWPLRRPGVERTDRIECKHPGIHRTGRRERLENGFEARCRLDTSRLAVPLAHIEENYIE